MTLSSLLPGQATIGALLLPSLALLPSCSSESSCTAEVTEARGIFRATITGTQSRTTLKREAIRAACGQLCGAQGSGQALGCVARCSVDAEDGKIGLRASCKSDKGGSAR
jgi:hypothetical protein